MKNKKIIFITLIIILLIMIFWFSGVIPKYIGEKYSIKYMSDNFSEMNLEFKNIEWSKQFGSYTVQFKDKEEKLYVVLIGPKYLPINLGQGLFAIEETYRDNYLEVSNKSNENNIIKIENNVITNEQLIDEFISNVKTSNKELCLTIDETRNGNSQTIIFKYIPGEKTISEIDRNIISQIYTESETPGIAMEKFAKLYGYYEFTVKSDNEDFVKKFNAYNYELEKNVENDVTKLIMATDLDVSEYLIVCQYSSTK